MSVAKFIGFKRTGRGGNARPGGVRERRKFYIPLFDAINRRNEQPTTVNIIFSSPLTIPTIKR